MSDIHRIPLVAETGVDLMVGDDPPDGLYTGSTGALFIDQVTPGLWQKTDIDATSWQQTGSGLARLLFTIAGLGSNIITGVAGSVVDLPAGEILGIRMMAKETLGSIVLDLWKDTWAASPPTVADTITASAKPTLTTAQKYQDLVLTGWNTTIIEGDTLTFNVDSASGITQLDGTILIQRT